MAPVSVLLVEDVAELRTTVRLALRAVGVVDVVDVGDGAAGIEAARRHQPDVVVVDLGLPDLAGHEVVTRLRSAAPAADIIVYTGAVSADHSPLEGRVEAVVGKDRDVRYLVGLITDLGSRPRNSSSLLIDPLRTQVAVARRFVQARCREWGCGDIVDEALVVVSELVTNGIVHGGGSCELRAATAGGVLRLQVRDAGVGTPDPRAARGEDEHGRGLLLVSALCTAWGVDPLPEGGKVVWAEILFDETGAGRSKERSEEVDTAGSPGASAEAGEIDARGGSAKARSVAVTVAAAG